MLFFIYYFIFLIFISGGWRNGITHKTQNWKVVSLNSHWWARPRWALGIQPHYKAPANLQVRRLECVPLTISYHLYFLCISKILNVYITGQWGQFTVKNATLCLSYTFFTFFCFSSKKKILLSFSFLFLMKYLISTINHSETTISETKLSEELYV